MFTFAQRICVCVLGVAGLYAQSTPTPPLQEIRTSAVVGLAEAQTGQVSVLNPGGAAPTGLVCSALLTIFDGQGKVLKTGTVNVPPGASRWLAVDSDRDLALHVDERAQIRATFTIPPIPPPTTSTAPTLRVDRKPGDLRHVERAHASEPGRGASGSRSGGDARRAVGRSALC